MFSRIWGGIHPPADDLSGRVIGEQIGIEAFEFAEEYIGAHVLGVERPKFEGVVYPNLANEEVSIQLPDALRDYEVEIFDMKGKLVLSKQLRTSRKLSIDTSRLPQGSYILSLKSNHWTSSQRIIRK